MNGTVRIGAAVLAGALALGGAGCCCWGGGHGGGRHGGRPSGPASAGAPAPGRQLEDLKAAQRAGAISGEEYEVARRRLVDQGGGAPALERR